MTRHRHSIRFLPNDCEPGEIRGRLAMAIGLLETVDELLSVLPEVQSAVLSQDLERFRLLSAAESLLGYLRGHGAGDTAETPAVESALGAYDRINGWSEGTTRQFLQAAFEDLRRNRRKSD